MRRGGMRRVLLVGFIALSSACTGETQVPPQPTRPNLAAHVASYDISAGPKGRFLVGLVTTANRFVGGGTIGMRFYFLGEKEAEGKPEFVFEATGEFLPLPGQELPAGPGHPVAVPAARGRGVYRAQGVRFDRPGIWGVDVTADLGEGDVREAEAVFKVLPKPRVPAPGERAIPSRNPTVGSGAPLPAIDSRAGLTGTVPDPDLHDSTIAEAIRSGRPAVVVFSTPVYCRSRFCGPINEMVEGLARDFGDAADFIHVEIWDDFQKQRISATAGEWLLRGGDLEEPWVFLIGRNGRILARWDNVATRAEIEPWLERLR